MLARFSPVPQSDQPQIEETKRMPAMPFIRSWNSSTTAIVRSRVCPSGSRQRTMMKLRSSLGRNAVGTLPKSHHIENTTPAKRTSAMTTRRTRSRASVRYDLRAMSTTALNGANTPRRRPSVGALSMYAQRTGERTIATPVEMTSAVHIVTANWTYIIPAMPE